MQNQYSYELQLKLDVMLRKMKIITTIILLLLEPIITLGNDDYVVIKDQSRRQAVFRYTIIEIPSQGKIDWIEGDVEIKTKDSYQFFDAYLEAVINEDIFLRLKKGAKIIIKLEDGSFIENEPVHDEVVFAFEIIQARSSTQN